MLKNERRIMIWLLNKVDKYSLVDAVWDMLSPGIWEDLAESRGIETYEAKGIAAEMLREESKFNLIDRILDRIEV